MPFLCCAETFITLSYSFLVQEQVLDIVFFLALSEKVLTVSRSDPVSGRYFRFEDE